MALIEAGGVRPRVHPTTHVAASAEVIGDVTIGAGSCVLPYTVIDAHDGAVRIGRDVVVMEHALIRGRSGHTADIGDFVMVGPHTHINGATVGDEVFVATGVSVFPGAVVGAGSELRVNAVVQVRTILPPGTVVPIGWVAVGDADGILPPDRHEEIWAVQQGLDFPGTVYGISRDVPMRELMAQQSAIYREAARRREDGSR